MNDVFFLDQNGYYDNFKKVKKFIILVLKKIINYDSANLLSEIINV